jgi:hypothetical protein
MKKLFSISILLAAFACGGQPKKAEKNESLSPIGDRDSGNNVVVDSISPHTEPPPFGDSNIIVRTPMPGGYLRSPLVVEGSARGNWFFEGSFPLRLLDSSGKQLAASAAKAEGNWMTDDWVPYHAVLYWKGYKGRALLLLEADNPSGLPERTRRFSYGVMLK